MHDGRDRGARRAALQATVWILCLAAGCSPRQEAVRSVEPRPVKTMVVAAGGGSYLRSFPGKVAAAKSVELAFQVPGLVVRLPVKEGQRVARGEMIAQLRQSEFQARREAAQGQFDQARAVLDALRLGERPEEQVRREAQLRAAEAKLANARTEFDRYARLLPTGAVSRSEYELSQTSYQVAQEDHKAALQLVEKATVARKEDVEAQEAQVRTLEGRLLEAKVELADSTLRAPYDGVIAQRLIDEGQPVTANRPVVKFQTTGEIDIVVDVPEAVMATGFRPPAVGQMVAEFSKAPGPRFPVRIKELAQEADPATQTFQVRFGMKAPTRVMALPGMTATVAVAYRRPRTPGNGIFVPISAVTRQDNGQQVVWLMGSDGTVRCRAVRTGEAKDGDLEISSGLSPGDRVVVAGAPFLREGMKVRDLGDALGADRP
jgi:membrane fusion protein, multidrug efflux system